MGENEENENFYAFNPIWTGFFANLKRLGGGGGGQKASSKLSFFKSDDNETWQGYTMGKSLYNLRKFLMMSS